MSDVWPGGQCFAELPGEKGASGGELGASIQPRSECELSPWPRSTVSRLLVFWADAPAREMHLASFQFHVVKVCQSINLLNQSVLVFDLRCSSSVAPELRAARHSWT
ncbi:hypothetical protein CgunFtcFv8_006781 [Champsocephalus gunnari]|uniref:Uncharacterized protein n=1 Tax=Champsocephalus gunnari TaxID=52237 RepID=A0AAN8H523_CHAGU|nr:hypothetical protein CgunFtcFv8_006781 [Champsocephalus gunnari]